MNKRKLPHKYPKNRKQRNTVYSTTWKLINMLGEAKLYEIWSTRGHLATSRYLTELLDMPVTYGMVLHLSRKFRWVRTITDKNLPLYRGILSGKLNPADYKSVKFA